MRRRPNKFQDKFPLVVKEVPTAVDKSARQRERRLRRDMLGSTADTALELETSCFADWSTHTDDSIYWSFSDFQLVQISSELKGEAAVPASTETGYVAITENVP